MFHHGRRPWGEGVGTSATPKQGLAGLCEPTEPLINPPWAPIMNLKLNEAAKPETLNPTTSFSAALVIGGGCDQWTEVYEELASHNTTLRRAWLQRIAGTG